MISGIVGPLSGSVVADISSKSALATTAAVTPFSGILHSIVEETSTLDRQANEAVTGLLNGHGIDIHDAMIATEKTDMAFELALQIRNKAVSAYQQMLNMQF